MRILIADDSTTARMIIRRCLEMMGLRGVEYAEAKDGQEALELAKAEPVDLIVADLNMPRLTGEELLASLKADAGLKTIPVLIASSATNPVRNQRLLGLGALATVCKPVSPASLREALGPLASALGGK